MQTNIHSTASIERPYKRTQQSDKARMYFSFVERQSPLCGGRFLRRALQPEHKIKLTVRREREPRKKTPSSSSSSSSSPSPPSTTPAITHGECEAIHCVCVQQTAKPHSEFSFSSSFYKKGRQPTEISKSHKVEARTRSTRPKRQSLTPSYTRPLHTFSRNSYRI